MSETAAPDLQQQLIEDIAGFTHDPLGYAMYAFPWGEGELSSYDGPREWQCDVLRDIGDHLSNPETRHQPLQIAIASGHGIGKSAEMGMILSWAMSTCEDCKIVVTANTENQLRTKTWPEIAKWQRLAINSDWFNTTATAVKSTDPLHDSAWKADAVPWSENNTEAFAGLHNIGKRIILIFDEASNIADKVWEVAEGALTDKDTEIIWLAFGNPTRNTGRFRECFRKYRHRWICKQIDSRTVEGTNKTQIDKWVSDYGEDSDFVKVRVRGIFPDASDKQFIPTGLTDAATHRTVTPMQFSHAPVVLGVDPAHQGADGAVIYLRQGLYCKKLGEWQRTTDDVWFAKVIQQLEDEHQADAVFIDYAYGTGLKSVGDNWGRDWQLVQFGSGSTDPQMANKRGEMYNSCKKWLNEGGCLDSQQVAEELSAPEFHTVLKTSKIMLEPKVDIKERIGKSPNDADALVLTFAWPVVKRDRAPGAEYRNNNVISDYDPYA